MECIGPWHHIGARYGHIYVSGEVTRIQGWSHFRCLDKGLGSVLRSLPFQVRFVNPDDIWLSMNFQRQSCHITVIIYNPSTKARAGYFSSLYHVLRDIGTKPRPHFGKYFNMTVRELQDVYPKYSDFVRVRKEFDPNDVFLNDMLAAIFSP